jgi:hypothetical protein
MLVARGAPVTPLPVRPIAFRILAILCALHVSGAHWLVLQTAAWTGMLVNRSQETTVSEAVRTTFDGEHPCALCQAVEEGQQKEKDNEPARLIEALANLSFIRPAAVILPPPTAVAIHFAEREALGCPRVEKPPIPPPRRA